MKGEKWFRLWSLFDTLNSHMLPGSDLAATRDSAARYTWLALRTRDAAGAVKYHQQHLLAYLTGPAPATQYCIGCVGYNYVSYAEFVLRPTS